MNVTTLTLYGFTFGASLILSLILVPAARAAAVVLDVLDHPHSAIKTHKQPVPYLGGIAIFLSFAFSLLWVRVLTSFPTGTLRSLRGIVFGAGLICLLGLVDDVKHLGLHYRTKFLFQILAAVLVVFFGVRIKFIDPPWFASALTVLWIVGVTNAFNLIDIMDGLSSGITAVAAAGFLFISLPTEEIYVNFAAAALCGATIGFLPYNLSKKWKIFMGDSGSLMLGFVCSSLALGTNYGGKSTLAVFTPLLILALPIYDTFLVSLLRVMRGHSPFVGSKDHFPLRLEALGWKRPQILMISMGLAAALGASARMVTKLGDAGALAIYSLSLLALALFTRYIIRVRVS